MELGVGLHIVLYNAIKYDRAIGWFFPWQSIVKVFLAAIVISALAPIGPLKRLLSKSIIESIRIVE